MAVITLTDENFEQVLAENKTVMVDFWASWCAPCRMLSPVIDQLAEEKAGEVTVGKINVDEQGGLASRFGVMSIPTVVVFQNGEEAARSVGVVPREQLLSML